MSSFCRRWGYAAWAVLIGGFALLHAFNLCADFPNHTIWFSDWAKYTDEGWYGNAAIRAHLFGNWYLRGDFNPAPAVPVWPFLEWVLFFFTGVSLQAARGLAIGFFFCNLLLCYLLIRAQSQRCTALAALTLMVTSPFLYCFSRLAILEPMLIALLLGALNLAIRLPRMRSKLRPSMRRPLLASAAIGLLYTLMMLTKTTAVFLLPALAWAMLLPLRHDRGRAVRCCLAAAGSFAASFGLWMMLIAHWGLMRDYKYLFFINNYIKPKQFYWPLISFWWSFHGGLWVDQLLIPLAGVLVLGAFAAWKSSLSRKLLLDPVFGLSILAVAGYILFMTYQNHPQPRYFAVVAFFSFIIVAKGLEALLGQSGHLRRTGWAALALCSFAVLLNGATTLNYAAHSEYSFVNAARRLTEYIDAHPNGKRLLVSISGDQITLVTQLPSLCDDFGTQELVNKLPAYQPGWYAAWNDLDPGTLEDMHTHYALEQVASYRAFDDPERNLLVLFKLHPLAGGAVRDPNAQNLQQPLPDDKISIPVQ